MIKKKNENVSFSINGQKCNKFLIQAKALVRLKVQSIQDMSSLKEFHHTDSKAKQSSQKKKLGVSNSWTFWELFEMLSFLSHGQFCTLTDYIWRPAGLQNQTHSTAVYNSLLEK